MTKRILFVTYGGGHAHIVYPVIRELQKQKEHPLSIEVIALPAAKPILKSQGIDYLGFDDFLDPKTDGDAIRWGEKLAERHHSPTIGVPLSDSIAYLGLSYQDLIIRYGEDKAAELLEQHGRHAFLPLTVMERIFDRLKPDCVVATNSPRAEAAAIETANQRNLPNLIMTDLISCVGSYKMSARHITFLSSFARDICIKDGLVDPSISECHITGNPAFDQLLPLPKQKDPSWIRAHFPECEGRPMVLYADNAGYWDPWKKYIHLRSIDEMHEEMDACHAAVTACGGAYLVRPHPAQDRNIHINWLKNKKNAYLALDCALPELLQNIDIVLARNTTVMVQGIYMHKKIVQLFADFHSDFPMAKMGVAWGARDYGALQNVLHNALHDEVEARRIDETAKASFAFTPAAESIAKLILRINSKD